MATRLLLVGIASDGPSYAITRPDSVRQIQDLYGGFFSQREFLSGLATGAALLYSPLNLVRDEVNGRANWLYYPQVSGSAISFGVIGGSGYQVVDFIYNPYLGMSDLVFSGRWALRNLDEAPYLCRVGGTRATLSIEGWEFEAKFPGLKYNRVWLTSNGSALTIWGLEPNYPTISLSAETPEDLHRLIDRKFNAGLSPVLCTRWTASLPVFSNPLSGGLDGSITAAEIETLVESLDIPVDCSGVCFLCPLGSAVVSSIQASLSDRVAQPRLFFFGAPTLSSPVSGWVEAQQIDIPLRSDLIISVVDTATVAMEGRTFERYAHEAAAIGYMATEQANLTNMPVDILDISTDLDEDDLGRLKSAGFVGLTRYVGNDLSTYQGVTTANDKSFLFSSKVAEIYSVGYSYCVNFIGRIVEEGKNPTIESGLSLELRRNVSYFQLKTVEVFVELGTMYVTVEGWLPDEILSISFSIKSR